MFEQLLIGSSATGALVYLLSRIRIYFRCDEPLVVIDSNDNEIVTVSDERVDIIVIKKKAKDPTCQNCL